MAACGAGITIAPLICCGAVQVAVGVLVLSGAVHPAGGVDRDALAGMSAVWDMWFLAWGLLLAVAVVAGWQAQRRSAAWPAG